MDACNATLSTLRHEADSLIAADGFDKASRDVVCYADVRYVGQNTALTLPIPNPPIDTGILAAIAEDFKRCSLFGLFLRCSLPVPTRFQHQPYRIAGVADISHLAIHPFIDPQKIWTQA